MRYNVEVMSPAVDFINSLSPKLRAKALRAIELLKEFGFRLGEPHSKTLAGTDGLKELRIKVGSDICRIFYFHHKNTLYVATSGYIKKEMKTDHGEIERAQTLREIFEKEMLQ
ncbi:type II toxin-antitoxin system RelE/ParE family toxin [Chlorobium ferrooxidans]|uniref:Type II toxin-antitoxin system RelE/ParE family toxin n=1 Tax=Chlorobium ferrooxidans DSM 13031 TaxID=377431 RepID=Q0YSE0_9CHLB|nr:type II toxin-antitoxin system RelE/ParE family toxin [Chlorobium ferrooxidans]EAT59288.1 Protein of unknown function DUF891 [Chlorobium ferrooxidans DSM 13031]